MVQTYAYINELAHAQKTMKMRILSVITYPDYDGNKFPLCEVAELNISLPEHVLSQHTNSTGT